MAAEITSRENAAVKQAVKLMNNAKERRAKGRFIVEGVRLCGEAGDNGVVLHELFYTQDVYDKHTELCRKLEEKADAAYLITESVAAKIADTSTPQGIFCVGDIAEQTVDIVTLRPESQFILLENIQDPANVGAVFRTAEALGLTGIFLSPDCCDPYNPKALRAAMGAVFRMPYLVADPIELLTACKAKGMRPIAAIPEGDASKITAIRFFKGVIMCVGNEGDGLSEGLIAACTERTTIPMRGRAESLNAATAAAILMWEMVRNYST